MGLYDDFDYPAFGGGKHLNWAWMKPIFVRNTIITAVTCGFWDWFLYFSPLKDKLHKYKMNPKVPTTRQFAHDAFFTMTASLQAAAVEIGLCWAWLGHDGFQWPGSGDYFHNLHHRHFDCN